MKTLKAPKFLIALACIATLTLTSCSKDSIEGQVSQQEIIEVADAESKGRYRPRKKFHKKWKKKKESKKKNKGCNNQKIERIWLNRGKSKNVVVQLNKCARNVRLRVNGTRLKQNKTPNKHGKVYFHPKEISSQAYKVQGNERLIVYYTLNGKNEDFESNRINLGDARR